MKLLWIFAVFCLSVSALPVDENVTRVNGENGWYVPRIDGTFEWIDMDVAETTLETLEKLETESLEVDLENVEDLEEAEEFGLSTAPVKYYLYTSSNPSKGKKITASTKSISDSYFNSAHPTRFVIHGWTQSYTSSMNKEIRAAWLERGDHNIIVVDWARARGEYTTSVSAVSKVGKKVASMIDYIC